MNVRELIAKLLELEGDGKGDYQVHIEADPAIEVTEVFSQDSEGEPDWVWLL